MDDVARHAFVDAADGLRLHVVDFGGPGRPEILFVHGSFGHARAWDAVASRLSRDRRRLAIDLPGHGDSDHAAEHGRYRFDLLAADLAQAIHELGLRPVVAGHSIGSALAMLLAARHGDLLAGAVLMDIDPCPPERQAAHLREAGRVEPRRYPEFEQVVARESRMAPGATPEIHRHLARHGYRDGQGEWLQKFDQAFLRSVETWDYRPLLGEITVPVLVLRGGASVVMSSEGYEQLLAGIPGATGRVIAGASHQLHLDSPDAVAAAIEEFVTGL